MEIKEIVKEYKFNKNIKRFSLHGNNHIFYSSIKSKEDIQKYQIHAFNAYENIRKIYPIHQDDVEQLEQYIKNYEISVNKGISMMDSVLSKWDITAEELREYIQKLNELYSLYDEFVYKKMCQD